MRPCLNLSESEISDVKACWIAGLSINGICAKFHHGSEQIRALVATDGWPERGDREPLPAGHSLTWGLLVSGTIAAGIPFDQVR